MCKYFHKILFFLALFLAFGKGGKGGNCLGWSSLGAQEIDMFSDWNNTMVPTTTPPVSAGSIPASDPAPADASLPPVSPGATATSGMSDADYSGYYKIGADLYYYDQRNGQFVIAVRGRANETSGSDTTAPAVSQPALASPYNSSFGSSSGGSSFGGSSSANGHSSSAMVNLFSHPAAASEAVCKEWRNPLRQKEAFESSSECQLDLEKSVDLALENLTGEKEQHEKGINPMTVDVPKSIRTATEIQRPQLQTALASLTKQGCNCVPR